MKILVGMSGGIDSTIAAYILKNKGYDVVGVNLIFNDPIGESVGASVNNNDTLNEISTKLGIEIITRDYRAEFREKIISSFVHDYENGITPNPCALCNGSMKFMKLYEVMKDLGCDMIATGHYANVVKMNHRFAIKKSLNKNKDQSYMLYRLSQEQLSHIIFPIGDMDKEEVREIGRKCGLSVAEKKDSQDICFIPVRPKQNDTSIGVATDKNIEVDSNRENYVEFIKKYELGDDYKEKIARGELSRDFIDNLPYLKKGEFIDEDGKVLGYHNGIINYTVGQRRGLNIAFGTRKFVKKIDAKKNQIVLSDNDNLMSSSFKIYDIVYSGYNIDEYSINDSNNNFNQCGNKENNDSITCQKNEVTYTAKLRYRHDGTKCKVNLSNGTCELLEPVRAITPGQAAVFYDENDVIMFGGRIEL